jgi:thymidylate synthase
MKNFNSIFIEATTLADAWFQTVYKCLEIGRDFIIDKGSYEGQKRLEFDYITIHIKQPGERPLLPKLPTQYNLPDPVSEEYLADYVPYLMTGELKKGEAYTYGQRISRYPQGIMNNFDDSNIWNQEILNNEKLFEPVIDAIDECTYETVGYLLNQIETIIHIYKTKGYRNNQMVLQVAQPSDLLLNDSSCLRHIDTRIQDNKLYFFPYFRSWDLWGGFPANLAAIQYLKEYMASEIGVEDGEIIASSKGLHLYNYTWELAEIIRGKTIKEFRKEN